MTTASNAHFKAEGLSWDSDPLAYLAPLPPSKILSRYDILDIGCGTDLLSLALSRTVRSVTAVDAAECMIVVLESKLFSSPYLLVELVPPTAGTSSPVCAFLQEPSHPRLAIDPAVGDETAPGRRFSLVVSHFALHRIRPSSAGWTVYGLLQPGMQGMVAEFEDFGPEARKFHPESTMSGVERHGVERGMIRALLEEAGFMNVRG